MLSTSSQNINFRSRNRCKTGVISARWVGTAFASARCLCHHSHAYRKPWSIFPSALSRKPQASSFVEPSGNPNMFFFNLRFVEQIYILYIHCTLPYLGRRISLKSVDGGGERTRSDIILGRLRTGIYTNMMVRTDHVWSCLILMIKVRSL